MSAYYPLSTKFFPLNNNGIMSIAIIVVTFNIEIKIKKKLKIHARECAIKLMRKKNVSHENTCLILLEQLLAASNRAGFTADRENKNAEILTRVYTVCPLTNVMQRILMFVRK